MTGWNVSFRKCTWWEKQQNASKQLDPEPYEEKLLP